MSKKDYRQLGWAAVGVVAGIVLFNNISALTRSTVIGRALEGRLVRSA